MVYQAAPCATVGAAVAPPTISAALCPSFRLILSRAVGGHVPNEGVDRLLRLDLRAQKSSKERTKTQKSSRQVNQRTTLSVCRPTLKRRTPALCAADQTHSSHTSHTL